MRCIERSCRAVLGAGWRIPAAAIAVLLAALPAPAAAQGLMDWLLGPPKPAAAAPPPLLTPGGQPYLRPGPAFSLPPRLSRPSGEDRSSPPQSERGGYRTVCVRLCDGYFFPVSQSVSRQRFPADADACTARCGERAKLFYMPASAEIDEAMGLDGRAYTSLTNAFRYRKTLVAGCGCRPAPWSEAELARHQGYAAAEARASAEREAEAVEEGEARAGSLAAARLAAAREVIVEDERPAAAGADVAHPAERPATAARRAPARGGPSQPWPRPAAIARTAPAPDPRLARAPRPAGAPMMSLGGGGLRWPGD
jgi:hypothetical protein